jgi:hypothetical protein
VGPTAGGPTSDGPDGDARIGSGRRQQQAGFSIFLDQLADEHGCLRWETRLYHAESGVETTLSGASPEHWVAWILERLGSAGIEGSDPRPHRHRAVVEVASVEIDDVTVVDGRDARGGSLHTIKARVAVQLAGVAPLEREIGSQILRGIVHTRTPPAG